MLRARRGSLELRSIHKQMTRFRIKAHSLCAELGLHFSCLAEVIGRIFVEDMNIWTPVIMPELLFSAETHSVLPPDAHSSTLED